MNENQSQNPTPPPPPQGGYYAQYPNSPHYAPQQPQRNGWPKWLLPTSLVVGCLPWVILVLVFFGFIIAGALSGGGSNSTRGEHIALIRVGGIITAGKSSSGGFLGGGTSGSETIVEMLEKARKNDNAKAIILRVNSPGGSPAGSEEVYKEIERVRSSGKPVYVSMADVAASGGYYISAPADRIYADTSTLTGSIGVIWDVADMSSLYKKLGISQQVIKSGKFKDIGSPNRPLTPDEKALLQGIVMDTYGKFVSAVSKGRNIPEADVRKIADGRVFTGSQAIKVKLVDRIGGLREVTLAVAKAGGIKGDPTVVEYGRRGFLTDIFGDDSEAMASKAEKAVTRELLQRVLENEAAPQGLR